MKSVCYKIVLASLCAVISHSGLADNPLPENAVRNPVKLPGLVIDFEKQRIDLEATICLDKGFLELVACSKGSKEHESIVAVSARAMHIHTALLLLGANNGHPAMRKQVGEEDKRWVNVPPQGDAIDVFLVTTNKGGNAIEQPISDFVVRSSQRIDEVDGAVITAPDETGDRDGKKSTRFPHTFLFAGSHLRDNGRGPRQYLADLSGNVISIATFGDELLCLPFHQTRNDNALMWRVKPESLPRVGTKVTLRLRPSLKAEPASGDTKRSRPAADGSELRRKPSGTNQ